MPENSYSEDDIQYLEPREHIRIRPGMYIGGTDRRALHHMVYEVLDHMAEEAFVGRCNHIWIELRAGNEISIRDNSLGLPVTPYEDTNLTLMEAFLQTFIIKRNLEPDIYEITGGLHGLGLCAINVLSSKMTVENIRDGVLWTQTYAAGKAQGPLQKQDCDHASGTAFTFTPDYTILDQNDFELERIEHRARELASQIADLTIEVTDLRVEPVYQTVFYYPEGLKSLIAQLNEGNTVFHEPVYIRQTVIIPRPDQPDFTVGIEIAFQFSQGEQTYVKGYSNTVETLDGGAHVEALRAGLWSCINQHIESGYRYKDKYRLTWEEIEKGLVAIVSVRHPDPQFVSPTKLILGNKEIYGPIAGLIFNAFSDLWGGKYAKELESIVDYHLSRRTDS